MRQVLAERRLPGGPSAALRLARGRPARSSTGLTVEDVATADHGGIDIALFSMGAAASAEWAPGGGRRRRHS